MALPRVSSISEQGLFGMLMGNGDRKDMSLEVRGRTGRDLNLPLSLPLFFIFLFLFISHLFSLGLWYMSQVLKLLGWGLYQVYQTEVGVVW